MKEDDADDSSRSSEEDRPLDGSSRTKIPFLLGIHARQLLHGPSFLLGKITPLVFVVGSNCKSFPMITKLNGESL
jgi:hypothetical protein